VVKGQPRDASSINSRPQVGINLSDPVFRGVYHGKKAHEDDLHDVVQRALDVGCTKMMVTGSSLKESKHAIDVAKQYRM
jgi:TatD DNase family protein